MPQYEVSRIIKSAMRFSEDVDIDGIRFHPVAHFESDKVIVSETFDANAFRDASALFDRHLLQVVDAVTIMSGSPLDPLGASTIIQKRRSKYIYLHAVKKRPSGQMTIWPEYNMDILDRSANAATRLAASTQLRSAAYYLRRAALADNIITSTFHSLQAAEVLATTGRRTDHHRLRTLMGDELYEYFRTEDPVLRDTRRHALAHGRLIDEEGLIKRNMELQERVLADLRNSLGGTSARALTAVRGFAVFETVNLFLERIAQSPDLSSLVDAALEHGIHSGSDPRLVSTEVSRRLWRRW